MEKNNSKIIAVFALVIAVIALSVGFAAFADDLTISGSATLEKNADAFDPKVKYTSTTQSCKYDDNTNAITTGYSAGTLTDDSWTGISVPLSNTDGRRKVTCTAQIENGSQFDAWLKSIATDTGLTCEAADSTNDPVTNLDAVCGNSGNTTNANVKVTVIIGSSTSSTDKLEIQGAQASNSNTTGKINAATGSGDNIVKGTTNAYVIFEYLGTVEPDGNVKITLPTVTHHYSTVPTN